MRTISRKDAEDTYTIIRHAIRSAAIAVDPEMWKALRNFEPDLDKPISTNLNQFFNKYYLKGALDEIDIQNKQGSTENSKEYVIICNIISLYIYLKISRVLYVDDCHDYFYEGFDNAFKIIREKNTNVDTMYELEEEILKLTDTHKWCFVTNAPFMLVGVFNESENSENDSRFIYIYIMEYNDHYVNYHYITICKNKESILNITSWIHNMDYSMILEHVNDSNDSLTIKGGFNICNLFAVDREVEAKDFKIHFVDKSAYKRALKNHNNDDDFKFIYTESTKKNSYLNLQTAYACHKGFDEYINREPEIKTLVERMERMTPSTLKAVEKDHPHINKLIQTLYKYEEFDDAPIKRVNRGGTHASPCEHERRETKRYNPKTGKRDIHVKGCTVNKGKEKAQYYKNK